MPEIISRPYAQTNGLPTYFTGEPCRHGHVAERRTDNAQCCGCRDALLQGPRAERVGTRAYAQAHQLRTYYTGKPCRRGHVAERRTDNSDCLDCIAMKKARQPPKRTEDQNRLRNERAAQARRETHDDALSIKRQALAGLGHVMQAAEAVARSRYLDDMIKAGANYIRGEG